MAPSRQALAPFPVNYLTQFSIFFFTKQTFGIFAAKLEGRMPKQKISEKDLIWASLKVFREQGYHNTSMADIGAACGLNKGSIYHHFQSKEELMKAVITEMHEHYKQKVFVYAFDERLPPLERLKKLSEFSEKIYTSTKNGCLMGNIALETNSVLPEVSLLIKAFFNDWIQAMAHVFSKKYDEETALALGKESVAEIEGAVMMMRIYREQDYLKRAHQRIFEKYEQGIPEIHKS